MIWVELTLALGWHCTAQERDQLSPCVLTELSSVHTSYALWLIATHQMAASHPGHWSPSPPPPCRKYNLWRRPRSKGANITSPTKVWLGGCHLLFLPSLHPVRKHSVELGTRKQIGILFCHGHTDSILVSPPHMIIQWTRLCFKLHTVEVWDYEQCCPDCQV